MRIDIIVWDRWNEEHVQRHRVKTFEVDDVLQENSYKSQFKVSGTDRLFVSGVTSNDRYLAVIIAIKGKNRVYPVTARELTHKERRRYKRWLQKKK